MKRKTEESYYKCSHEKVNYTGAAGVVSDIAHRSMECHRWLSSQVVETVLEVGARQGQHFKYVKHPFRSYLETHLDPNLLKDCNPKDVRRSSHRESINVESLPFPNESFDRVIATCLLAHVASPELMMWETMRVLRPSGIATIYIPCEPEILLRVSQILFTRRKQKKLGLDAHILHYREHRNHYPGMLWEVRVIVRSVPGSRLSVRRFPTLILGWNCNLWAVATIRKG